jgi:predicted MFS family arabinose efflux permease
MTVTVAVGALTYAISRAESGWSSPSVAFGLVVCAAFVALSIVTERRAAQPLIPLAIFRHRTLVVGNLTIAAIGAIMTATVYFLSLYQQRILELSPMQTGLTLVPMSIVLAAGALASKRLLQRYDAPGLIITGSLTMAVGLAWLAAIPSHSHYLTHVLGPTLVWGLGASIVIMPCVAVATSDIDPTQAGLASGLVNTARQVGGAIGLAVLASIAAITATHSAAHDAASKTVHGYSIAFIASALIAVLIALSTLATHTPKRRPSATGTVQPSRSTSA